ncbi:MAG TPA: RecX family transcriptional regulator [Chloroflexota bacterium]|nr:RecX family transcriptional regulator [Chloroflexota bacterium]
MTVITALEQQQHDPERINVFLDGKFGFGASRLLVVSAGLREGDELSPEDIERLKGDDLVERAYGAALNFLSYRPRSRRELEDYFRRKKIAPDLAARVFERLEQLGLLDDREFARFWVENRQAFRPRGSHALRGELRLKGVESEVVEDALQDIGDEEELAFRAGSQRLRSYGRVGEREFFRRMVGFLQRRGFGYSAASAATRRLSAARNLPLSDDLPLESDEPDATQAESSIEET